MPFKADLLLLIILVGPPAVVKPQHTICDSHIPSRPGVTHHQAQGAELEIAHSLHKGVLVADHGVRQACIRHGGDMVYNFAKEDTWVPIPRARQGAQSIDFRGYRFPPILEDAHVLEEVLDVSSSSSLVHRALFLFEATNCPSVG